MDERIEQYDFIVVGGGSSGCVTAAKLVREHRASVLLIEEGQKDHSPLFRMPAGFIKFLKGSRHLRFNKSIRQLQLGGREPVIPTARVLGGGSTVNAMNYIRGQPVDFEAWDDAVQGKGGWNFSHMTPYFRRMERNERLHNETHGVDGALGVSDHTHRVPISHDFVTAVQGYGLPFNPDFNDGHPYGVGYIQLTARNARRCSAVDAFLRPVLSDEKLTLRTNAQVLKILLEKQRAVGIRYRVGNKLIRADARREIIVCAGAFETPKLLMLSGIGPRSELERNNIPVAVDLPGVGANLHDHCEVGVVSSTTEAAGYLNEDIGLKMLINGLQYLMFRTGPVASNGIESCAFLAPDGDTEKPSIQLFCVPSVYVDSDVKSVKPTHGLTLISCILRPKSRGSVRLNPSNPGGPPIIDPQYLSEPQDMEIALKALRISRDILRQSPLTKIMGEELLPGKGAQSDADLEKHCRETVKTGYHPAGTCKMGHDEDPLAVLTYDLRVRGVAGLRVFDASMMPVLTSGNCNATVMAVADKAVDMMMGKAPLDAVVSVERKESGCAKVSHAQKDV
jgi:choline dehydrogenase